jgi:tetratricopeptide (TPR) repeat protein
MIIMKRDFVTLKSIRRSVCLALLMACVRTAASAPAGGLREIGVKLLADEEFRSAPGWLARAESLVRSVSADFESGFGLRVVVRKIDAWISEPSLHTLEDIGRAVDARIDKEGCEVLVVFTSQAGIETGYTGFTLFKEGIIIFLDLRQLPLSSRTLKHEMGHLFGAVHVPDPESVMDCFVQGDDFDARNAEVIRLCRERTFNGVDFPLPRQNWEALAAIYESIGSAVRAAPGGEDRANRLKPGIRGAAGPDGKPDPFHLDDPYLMLAQIRLEQKRFVETIEACRTALSINPDNIETRNVIGIARRRQGSIGEAVEIYGDILRGNPGQSKVVYNLGIALAERGDLVEARAAYERALTLKPNFAEAYNNLGELALREGRREEARASFVKAMEICPSFALAHANAAEVYLQDKDGDRALAEVQKALELAPDLPSAHNVLGNILHEQGRTEEAIASYRKALAFDPNTEKPYFNLGICLFDQDRLEEAEAHFRKAVELKPRFGEAHASLGYCLLRRKSVDEGIGEIRLAQELGFHSAKTHLNLSFAFLEKGMTDEAIAEARCALDLDPKLALARNNLGIAYARQGQIENAFHELAEAVALDPDCQDALWNLGNLQFQAGRFDRALDLYLRMERLAPRNGALLNNIAVVYFRLESYRLSWEYVKKAEAAGFAVHSEFLSELKKKLGPSPSDSGGRPLETR